MSSDKLYKTNLFKTKRRQIESLTSSGMFHNIIRRTIHRTRRFSPLTLVFIVTLIITIPVLIKTSSLEILDYGLLNSYQDTNTRRDHTFNNLTGCNDISQYLSDPEYRKQNASIVMLTRNNELEDVIKSLDSIETHFNQWFEYPYVFLNDVPFDDEFMDTVRNHTRAQIEFDTLRPEEWEFSMDNDTNRVIDSTLQLQGDRGVLYGNMKSYHQMCRFYSGKFYENELVKQYEWYWRLEPNIDFFCDITYDPFYEMARNGKKYGFTIIIPELYWTIPNLFRITMSYIRERSIKVGTLWNLFTYDYGVVNNDWNATRDDMYHEVDSGTQYLNKFINHESDVHQVIKDRLLIDQFVREGYGDETNGVGSGQN